MGGELVLVQTHAGQLPAATKEAALPVLVERAGGAARFAWDEFFYAEHHNPHTQKAYMAAVRRFLSWCEGQGVELPPSRRAWSGKYLVGLGGSAAKRNLHLSALRGFFDRLVQSACGDPQSGRVGAGRQGTGDRGQDAGNHRRAGPHAAGVDRDYGKVKTEEGETVEVPCVVGLRDRAILATLAYTACRAGAVAKLRLQDFQNEGKQYVLRFQEKGGKSREIPVRHDLERDIRAYLDAAGIAGEAKDRPLFRSTLRRRSN